ncbi:uncharacterized protein ColSpa_04641 [Colletotrichum spaethianum]|uniref:Uncharacterized protein n=1 Tax=Colletotrichum spaethianum TaxID=700344 RepID=A0AA37LD94_9PEZI|nr:uncharacterized protein ColSpa_04641 [Colletotrichum spaethianum]GKT44460.1 hypothetical protein ColSpa_04641 [Colletotrichum spaethianum]
MLLYGPVHDGDAQFQIGPKEPTHSTDALGSSDRDTEPADSDASHSDAASSHRDDPELFKVRKTTPEDFLSRLPSSLKILHIGRITAWFAMYRDALALAEQDPFRFPQIWKVSLEVLEGVVPPEEEIQSLNSAFNLSGITLCLGPVAECYLPGLDR